MKKGFTLIELLAVIVILAIIALIAIPQISKVIENTRFKSLESSANGLIDAAEIYHSLYQNDDLTRFDINNNVVSSFEPHKLSFKGSIKQGTVLINSIGQVAVCVTDGLNSAYKNLNDAKVTLIRNKVCSISNGMEIVNLKSTKGEIIKADIEVNSITDLIKLDVSVNKIVHTKGYNKINDGGDAYYKIVSEGLDNPKYTKLNNGLYASIIVQDNTLNVRQFGALGNSSTDDTTAIINALKASSGYTLYFPKGTYMVSSKLSIPNDITILGEADESIIMATEGYDAGTDLLNIYYKKNITIDSITVSGNSTVNNKEAGYSDIDGIHLLDIWGGNNITIKNSTFKDNIYTAIRMVKGNSKMTYINNKFYNVDCCISALGPGDITDLLIDSNYVDGHINSEPISLFGTGIYKNIIVRNNTIKNKYYGHAIYMGGQGGQVIDAEVTNNKIYNCAVGIYLDHGDNVLIKDNIIDMADIKTDSKGGTGLKIYNSNNIRALNNKISNTVQFGFQSKNCTDCLYKGNTIENAGYLNNNFFHVDIRGTNSNVIFEENKLIRTDTSLYQYVLAVDGDGGVKILNNEVTNGKFWLKSTSSNIIVNDNKVEIYNQGKDNIITN